MPVFTKFNSFVLDVATKVHNLGGAVGNDTLKLMLTDSPPTATNTVKSNITEIAAGNGYTAGGNTAAFVSGNDTSGVYKLILSPVSWTASGGAIAQFRYVVLYNSSTVNGNLIGWWDFGAEVNLASGNTFTANLDPVNGVLTLT